MPGPKTHQIFYKQLKNYLSKDTLDFLPGYENYSIFAQGHDLLIYHDFYKMHKQEQLAKNIASSKLLQEHSFSEFVYCYLKCAEELRVLNNRQVRLFIGPGYIGHHLLDAYTHPLIIYFAGDHVRDTNNKTWRHGIAENLIDIYLMKRIEKVIDSGYQVHKDFEFPMGTMSKELITVLDTSLEAIYGIADGGKLMEEACSQVFRYMRFLKYDPKGIKKIFFDRLDPLFKGTASFSYCRSEDDAEAFLNNDHAVWVNPMDNRIQSQASFMERYQKALHDCGEIIDKLEALCTRGNIQREEVQAIIPNVASTHGLQCGKTIEIKYTKETYAHDGK